jgi:predicted nuclease of predicted toxin-antitoxin system
MSRIRYLADHDFKETILTGLLRRDATVHIVRTREVNLAEASDAEVLDYAAREGFIIVSHDLRTMPAHAYARVREGLPMAGVFMVRQTDPIGPAIENLFLLWASSEAEEWSGQVIYLPL